MKSWVPKEATTQYFGLGLQLAVTILLGVFIGYFLDQKYQITPWGTITGAILGLFLSFAILIQQLMHKKNGS